jgi:Flp pilus assembly protein TadD
MRAVFIALSSIVTIGCVVYVAIGAHATPGGEALTPAAAVAAPPPAVDDAPTAAPAGAGATTAAAAAAPGAATPAEPAAEPNSRDAQPVADRALADLDNADYDGARAEARRCLELDPRRSSCHYALTMSYVRRGEWDAAYPLLQTCVKIDPGNDACMSELAQYHVMHKELDDARRLVDSLNVGARDSTWTHLASAEYARATGDRDGACAHFRAACDRAQLYACIRAQETCNAPRKDD